MFPYGNMVISLNAKKESFDLIQSLLPVVTVTQVISIVILSHRDVYFSNLLAEIQ